MPRQSEGLVYFPFYVVSDEKLDLIEAEFGFTGFAVIVKLWQRILGRGYYCEWTDEVALLFAKSIGLGGNVVSEIIEAATRRGIFDKRMREQYGILTSEWIQETYFDGAKRRKQIKVEDRYLLVQVEEFCPNVNIIRLNVDINPENVDRNQQSRVEKSRGKKSREIPSGGTPSGDDGEQSAVILLPLKDGTEYIVHPKQVEEWTELYPGVDILQELKKMRGWLTANPARQKTPGGVLRFITGWLAREQGGAAPKTESASKPEPPANRFNDFPQRDYDFDEIERQFRIN